MAGSSKRRLFEKLSQNSTTSWGSPFEWWNIAAHGEPCLRCGWMCWIDLESRCFQCVHEYFEDTWRYSDVEDSWNRGAPQIIYFIHLWKAPYTQIHQIKSWGHWCIPLGEADPTRSSFLHPTKTSLVQKGGKKNGADSGQMEKEIPQLIEYWHTNMYVYIYNLVISYLIIYSCFIYLLICLFIYLFDWCYLFYLCIYS